MLNFSNLNQRTITDTKTLVLVEAHRARPLSVFFIQPCHSDQPDLQVVHPLSSPTQLPLPHSVPINLQLLNDALAAKVHHHQHFQQTIQASQYRPLRDVSSAILLLDSFQVQPVIVLV